MIKQNDQSDMPCITIHSHQPTAFATFGLPCEKGVLYNAQVATFKTDKNDIAQTQSVAQAHWPDGSIRWLNVDGLFKSHIAYSLNTTACPADKEKQTQSFKAVEPAVNINTFCDCLLTAEIETNNKTIALTFDHTQLDEYESNVSRTTAIKMFDGRFPYLQFKLKIVESLHSGETFYTTSAHNLKAASHPNGTWDLGDERSVIIHSLNLVFSGLENTTTALAVMDAHSNNVIKHSGTASVYQHSSGGKNDRCATHVNAGNRVDITQSGYEIQIDGNEPITGQRATPLIEITKENANFCLHPHAFWQNFPASLSVGNNEIIYSLFPKATELQAGESKTWQLSASPTHRTAKNEANIEPPQVTRVVHHAEYIDQSQTLVNTKLSDTSTLDELIKKGIDGPNSFFEKAEVCDEFGWRNYGELYADHEAIGQTQDDVFVSHYNNQYDPTLGTLLQSIKHADSDWHLISAPLVQHVMDIDIYNTEADKPEYNGGLFWHTDHYLPAATCTHRTYSKHHSSVYDGHQGGGGPGGQHCYTSGLTLNALLFNDAVAKQKVLRLTQWIRCFYQGDGSILGRLHRFLTVDLKPNQLTNIGIIQQGYRYPLDRGTGHFINALCDSFELTDDAAYLKEAASVIRCTVGLSDNLNERDLSNVENSWFYTVFLQSTIKFLLIKESRFENDRDYAFALQALKQYCDWMANHEEPYLNHPEDLEFPNDTWAAQDVRKANIFYAAHYFFGGETPLFKEKADAQMQYVVSHLSQSPEADTTRILAILMQNDGFKEKLANKQPPFNPIKLTKRDLTSSGYPATIRLLMDIPSLVRKFSLKREVQWLNLRLGRAPAFSEADA